MTENGPSAWEIAKKTIGKHPGYVANNPFAAVNLGLHDPLSNTTQPSEVPQRIQSELAGYTLYEDPKTHQKFGVIEANMDMLHVEEHVATNVVLNLFANSISETDAADQPIRSEVKYRIEQIARLGNPTISIDPPCVGASDWLRWDQLSTNPKDSYFAIADAQLRALKARGITRINLIGQSFGAFQAAALAVRAGFHDMKVDNVLLYEPTGVVGMSMVELGMLNKKEYELLDFHSSAPFDPEMVKAANVGIVNQKSLKDKLWMAKEFWRKDPFFVYGRSMAAATLQERIGRIVANQTAAFPDHAPTRIRILSGEESTICPWKQVKEIVDNYPELKEEGLLRYEIVPNEGHLAFINAKRWLGDVRVRLYPEKSFAEATRTS